MVPRRRPPHDDRRRVHAQLPGRVRRAEIDVYDSEDDYYFGRHARPTLMYDSEDGMMMDSDGEPYGRRDVCCVM